MRSGFTHSTGDEALSRLSMNSGTGGDLVRSFPGRKDTEDTNWLETWFRHRIEKRLSKTSADSETVISFDSPLDFGDAALLSPSVKLRSIQAHFFRGFRESESPINLTDDFIVIEGQNSTGKTSLAEALEWLFLGTLSRRESSDTGNARELENCITNQFRPAGADTWVSASFSVNSEGEDEQEFSLRRVLREDYGSTSTAECRSVLHLDDEALTRETEQEVLDKMFAGVPPLLMQHTLRDFVQGEPKVRREYFERLLRLDELTELIRQAVVTDDRASSFKSPNDDIYLQAWFSLRSMLENEKAIEAHRQAFRGEEGDSHQSVKSSLFLVARSEFPTLLNETTVNEQIVPALEDAQERVRKMSFPILDQLRPLRQYSDDVEEPLPTCNLDQLIPAVRNAWTEYEPLQIASEAIGEKNIAVSKAFKVLMDAGTFDPGTDSQICPLCAFEHVETLSAERVTKIEGWNPIQEAESKARRTLNDAMNSLLTPIKKAIEEYDGFLPPSIFNIDWEDSLKDVRTDLQNVALALRNVIYAQTELNLNVSRGRTLISAGVTHPNDLEQCETFITECQVVVNGFSKMPTAARTYRVTFDAVEAAVKEKANTDASYRRREQLLECIANSKPIYADLLWERAKRVAMEDLRQIRESLISFRHQFLEARRVSFNDGIGEIWSALRKDRYSSFSKLHIPAPRGRGFPIGIELKALLDDTKSRREVDVLRVFSESQVNALGVAAFVTRAKLLGHKILVLDDPVQSMDEDHFKTFARDLIHSVLNQGFQVILLTHNEAFARDVSHFHYDYSKYVTMSIRHSRSEGAVVEEGNRRVAERLKLAEHRLDQGRFRDAWIFIRLAIERLYTISYAKYGPTSFKPESWQHQSAEYMWKSGAGDVILSKQPDSGNRINDILKMSASGAHDTSSSGETDIRDSLEFLSHILSELKIGG